MIWSVIKRRYLSLIKTRIALVWTRKFLLRAWGQVWWYPWIQENWKRSYSLAAPWWHQYQASVVNCKYTQHNHKNAWQYSADIARARDCDRVISRWSPFGSCWVSTRELKREADGDLLVFSSRKQAKWCLVSNSFSSHHRISPLLGPSWLWQHYRIERRRRRARSYDALLWCKFVRHCLVGFYVI